MNTAIERIKGYCCEVTQEQWAELVRVADEVGVEVSWASREHRFRKKMIAAFDHDVLHLQTGLCGDTLIPFPDFLAKLKGDEKWQPKAGEMVEVSDNAEDWYDLQYIATRKDVHVCWCNDESTYTRFYRFIRPIRPTITRAEAEAQLNKRIID